MKKPVIFQVEEKKKKKREKEKRVREGSREQSCNSVLAPQWWWGVGELCTVVSGTLLYPTLPLQAPFSGDLGSCTEAD